MGWGGKGRATKKKELMDEKKRKRQRERKKRERERERYPPPFALVDSKWADVEKEKGTERKRKK